MANLKPTIDYTSKDYEAFRNDMLGLIQRKMPEYTDFSESDFGVALIEAISYVADILSYYQDRIANEAYLFTATQRKSVIDIVKMLSYRLKNAVPSTTELVFTRKKADTDLIIPKGTSVSTEGNEYEDPINFETDQDLIIPKGAFGDEKGPDGEYLYKVTATQGITIPEEVIGSSNGQPLQRFKLKYQDVIDGSVEVFVDEGSGFELWTDVTDNPTLAPADGRYYTRETDEDRYTWIVFGDGLNGKIPEIGSDNILATYRIGGGLDTNVGANTITVLNSNDLEVDAVFNPIPATGGMDYESIDDAKVNAPKLFKTRDRAVTKEDYEALALSVPGVGKAIAVPDDTIINTVHVTVAPNGGGQPSEKLLNDVYQLLDDKKVITTQIIMEQPKYVMARISFNVQIEDGYQQSTVRTFLIEAMKSLFDFNTRDFGQGMPISRIYHDLMTIDGVYSVDVTRMTTKPLIEFTVVSGDVVFDDVVVLPSNTYSGDWKVVMDSETDFTVYQVAYDGNGNEILTPKGSGTVDETFTSDGNEIQFTIQTVAGGASLAQGDTWRFHTLPYLGNLTVGKYEMLLLDEADLQITMTGGSAQ